MTSFFAEAALFAAALLPALVLFAEEGNGVHRTEDVIYGRKFGMCLTLDVFQPPRPNRCALLFLVNGGWQSSKATPLMVTIRPADYEPFLKRGYTVFAVVTSSQPKFTIPEIAADVARAASLLSGQRRRYGVRPDRIGILGSSSGGHLTLLIAAQGRPGDPRSAGIRSSGSRAAVEAVACFFPRPTS